MSSKKETNEKRLIKSILCEDDCLDVMRTIADCGVKINENKRNSKRLSFIYDAFEQIDAIYEKFIKNSNSNKNN